MLLKLQGEVQTTPEPVHLSPNATCKYTTQFMNIIITFLSSHSLSLDILGLCQVLRYGSHVSLKSTDILCWLHSHPHLYPLKYLDGRGSSYQQQITCYEFTDVNNLWEIRKPLGPVGVANKPDSSPVWNKDTVELVHVNTSKILNR